MYPDRIENAQRVLRALAGYTGEIDGDPGPISLAAAARVPGGTWATRTGWSPERRVIAGAQLALSGAGFQIDIFDGLYGPETDAAYTLWRADGRGETLLRNDDPARQVARPWGAQANTRRRFGDAGGPACTAGQVTVPWAMHLAWDPSERITSFACHRDVAASAQRVLERVADLYSSAELVDLGLDSYGGCFNLRRKRGGSSLSMHSWGVAIDFDPARNRLGWDHRRARLAQADAIPFWSAWRAEGWTSLGRERDFDWMHVQAPAL